MKNFEALLNEKIDLLPESNVREAMRYSLLAGGKRIRPSMLYCTADGYGFTGSKIDDFACAIEMIHTYSLIHDDLPAMDNDDLRRGRPTCHKQFDEATAILAGDGLLTYAFSMACTGEGNSDDVRKAAAILAEMAGSAGMVLGQDLDMAEERGVTDWDALKKVHKYKTGCLLSAPLMIGAQLCGRSRSEIDEWHNIGILLGLAFQIQDDILDVELTPEEFGKSNSDERNEKVTSVTLLGRENAAALMSELYKEGKERTAAMPDFDGTELIALISSMENRRK